MSKDVSFGSSNASILGQGFTDTIWVNEGAIQYNDPMCNVFHLANGDPNLNNNK